MDFLKEPKDFKFFTDSGNLFHNSLEVHCTWLKIAWPLFGQIEASNGAQILWNDYVFVIQ